MTSDKFLKILTNESIGEESMPLTNRENFEEEISSPQPRNIRSSHSDSDIKTPRINSKQFFRIDFFFLLNLNFFSISRSIG